MSFNIAPQLKAAIDQALHKAKMAHKAGQLHAAADAFDAAANLMSQYAEDGRNRAEEHERKAKAIKYRDLAKQLRETGSRNASRSEWRKQPVIKPGDPVPPASDDPAPALRESGDGASDDSTKAINSAVAGMVQSSPLTWADIGGLDETKQEIKYTLGLSLAKPPEGLKLHTFRNILFYGPPGTGKTILAAATSNALKTSASASKNALFFNVKVSGVMSKYFGESSKIISEIYGTARDNSPSVVFLDEFESLTSKRGSDEQSGAERRILSTILSELDGLSEKGRSDIFVLTIAATNRPWDVDSAVLSRFEKRILIPLPDADARREIIAILFTKRGFTTSADIEEVVAKSEGFSGREIERLCKEVTTRMIRRQNTELPSVVDQGLENARGFEVKIAPITMEDWLDGISRITPATSKAEMERYTKWNDSMEE